MLTDGHVFEDCCAGALNNLACLYEHGSELTARDISVAIEYYRAAAQLGCAAAQAGSSLGMPWRGTAERRRLLLHSTAGLITRSGAVAVNE